MELGTIRAPDGTLILVELVSSSTIAAGSIEDLPEGAEPTGVTELAAQSMEKITKTINAMVEMGTHAIKQHGPSEWTIQFEIGFKGKVNPIPILVSSEAEAVLKVTAKWTRG